MPDAIEGPEEVLRYHAQIKENAARIKELEDANDELKTAVQLAMGDKSVMTWKGVPLFTWKEQKTTRLDQKRLKEEAPEVWEQFAKTATSRVFLTK